MSLERLPQNNEPAQEMEPGYPGMEREELLAEIVKDVCGEKATIDIDGALAELLATKKIYLEDVPGEADDEQEQIPNKFEDFFQLVTLIDLAVNRNIISEEEEIALFNRIKTHKKLAE